MQPFLIFALFLAACPAAAFAQSRTGELRVEVRDAAGRALETHLHLASAANEYSADVLTDAVGKADVSGLAYGFYLVTVQAAGFAEAARTIEVRSAIPVESMITLAIKPVSTEVRVQEAAALVDPDRTSSAVRIGASQVANRVGSLPGRSLQDLIASQPGWVYEGSAVLHPRGSEYQTQFVVDGIPLTDNRSPGLGPEIEADDVDSMTIYTAGFPAEYGRKMGGVVELNTRRSLDAGLHGEFAASGGSYDTLGGFSQIQDTWSKNTLGATASGDRTAHYLNPVVPENFTNRGTTGDFSGRYERELSESDRLILSVRHELSRFEIPNEQIQQQAGQLQTGDNFETIGTAYYQHTFSPDSLGTFAGMVRDKADDLFSNDNSTPILAFQHNDFREGYFKAAFSLHRAHQELKAGVEFDAAFLHENFSYLVTDPAQFDDSTPPSLALRASRPDLEQSAFLEDLIRAGKWTVSAGLRWDHYQLISNQNAWSPRLSVARSLPSLNAVLHASYDRIFQTPAFENILISSSPEIDALSSQFLRLPVKPSLGNYYEGGLTQAFSGRLRLDANMYRRDVNNYADDNQLLNTGVSYPIAFRKAVIYGAEGKLELVSLGKLNGFASYSYMVGNAWFPVTGGLFLGDDASAAATQVNGHFPDSQDQRNTLATRFRYQAMPRVWLAAGAGYGSGLPFEFAGDQSEALAEYGRAVVSRVNFDRGRIRPLLAVNASLGVVLSKSDKFTSSLQVDGENLNNRLNVIDFNGLFSENAIGPERSYSLRLNTSF